MKVKLATQLFIKSVADALEALEEELVEGFNNTAQTVEFMRVFEYNSIYVIQGFKMHAYISSLLF